MTRLVALILLASAVPASAERLSVDDAVKLALSANPRYRAVRSRAAAAHDQAASARGRFGFTVRLSEEYQHWDCPFGIAFVPAAGGCQAQLVAMFPPVMVGGITLGPTVARQQDTNAFGAIADQPLLGLGHIGYDWAAQRDTARASDANVAVGAAAIREAVRNGFLSYFEARALVDIASASVEELSEQVKVARARVAAGVDTNADLLRVVVAEANARQQKIVAQTQADVARANLLNLIGLPPDDLALELEEPRELLAQAAGALPELPGARREAEARRPEIARARFSLSSARHNGTARALSLLPDIDAEGGYLRVDGQLFALPNQWFVGVRASWAIWEWGTSFYQARSAARLAQAAAFDLEDQQRGVATEVQNSIEQTRAAGVAVDVAMTAITSAEEAYRVTQALLQAGSATTTDLLDSQAALTTARLNLARAQYERAMQRVTLSRIIGE
jgi:outer membrane protein